MPLSTILSRPIGALTGAALAVTSLATLAPAAAAVPAAAVPAVPAAADPSGLDRRIAAASQQLEIIVEDYNDVRVELRATTARAAGLGRDIAPLEHSLAERDRRVGNVAGDTYRRNVSGPAVALFGSDSPDQFIGQLLVLDRLGRERRRAVEELAAARGRVALARQSLVALAELQRRQEADLAARKAKVEEEIARLQEMRRRAYGGAFRLADDAGADAPPPPYVPGPAGAAVRFAYGQLGKWYQWGASGPSTYDCSGLTSAAWARAGVHLPHNARRQYHTVARISRDELRPGDLIFYYGGVSHVAIYIGAGRMIHAPEYGERIRVDRVDYQPVHGYGRPR